MMRRLHAAAVAAALAVAACAGTAHAKADTPRLPLVLDGDESVATTDDARALFFNPADAGLRYPMELYEEYRRYDSLQEWNTTAFTAGGTGLYGLRQRDSLQTYGASFAFGGERLRWGVSPYELVANQPKRERVLDYRVGVLSRPRPWLSTGFTVDRLFQPLFRGERRQRHYDLGVGLRPFALSPGHAEGWGTRLTLSADVIVVDDGDWRQARSWVSAEFEPLPGMSCTCTVADHDNVRLGLTLRGVGWAAHGSGASQRDRPLYQSYALSLHRGDEPGVVRLPAERRVAVVSAAGTLADESMGGASLTGGGGTTSSAPLRRRLDRALEDPLTRGVLLDVRHVGGMAQVEELRPRIAALRAAGKPVVAYLEEGGGRADLYLAGACDRIVAGEESGFGALGLRTERRFWRDALERAGVRVQRSSVGAYKSAYRNLSTNAMPAADSVVVLRDLEVRQQLFVDALTHDRGIPPQRLAPVLDGRTWSSADLVAAGVIDSVGYREDALRTLGRLAGLGDSPRAVDPRDVPAARRAWTRPERVAVVYAGGGIETGRSGNDLLTGPTLGSATLVAQLERAFHTRSVRAVVLRIESPGGSTLASNLIGHAVERLEHETGKPLVVSMGSVAASGGYYIACHANRIYADRHTRTGAIGVLVIQPSFEGLYGKLRVHQEEFDRGAFMPGTSWSRDWTPEEQASADSAIGRSYRVFLAKVAAGRHLPPDSVAVLAQGRVWMGDEARANGLVDAIGGLDDAVREARRLGGIPADEPIRRLELGRPRGSFLQRALGGWVRETLAREARLPEFGSARMEDPGTDDPLAD